MATVLGQAEGCSPNIKEIKAAICIYNKLSLKLYRYINLETVYLDNMCSDCSRPFYKCYCRLNC
jgi:hypothetical protein